MSKPVWIGLGLTGFALAALIWVFAPVYGFFAHRGEAPFTPFGWVELPAADAPVTQTVHNPLYAAAGEDALARIEAWRSRIGAPSMSAAVAVGGERVWEGAAGWSDLARETPVTTDDLYRVGSTSKAITAIALARLVDAGVMDLDTPIQTYWADELNPAWADITARQLASHMAGMPHYGDNTETLGLYQTLTMRAHFDDVRDAVAMFDESEMLFAPGERFEYSSLGTVLLGATMSEASGMSYRELIARDVFEPAGVEHTIVAPKRPGPPMVSLYYREGDRYRIWRPVDLSARLPGGGWASRPSDLVQIGSLMLDDDFVSPDIRAQFWTPQQLNNGETNPQDYAIGWRWRDWEIEGVGAVDHANHGGVSRGSQSWLMVIPEHDMVIAFTMNARTEPFWEFGGLFEEIASAFVPVVTAPSLSR